MSRFGNSWRLVKLCGRVLASDKQLIVFPILSSLAMIVVVASFAVPSYFGGVFNTHTHSMGAGQWALLIAFYFVAYFVMIFFNAALVSAALMRLRGQQPTVADGIREAGSHLGAILGFAAISATIGLVLRLIAERFGAIGQIASGLLGAAWSIVTFLAVPTLVAESAGPWRSLTRSSELLKKTWGEQLIGRTGLGLVFGLLIFAVIIVGIALIVISFQAAMSLGIAVSIIMAAILVIVGVVSSAFNGVYGAALYEFASGQNTNTFFDEETMRSAFVSKRAGKLLADA